MKEMKKLENTRFQIKEILEFGPVNSNVKYAQMRSADLAKGMIEMAPVRGNVKYAQVASS